MKTAKFLTGLLCTAATLCTFSAPANADFTIEFDNTNFAMTPVFNRLRDFSFSIDVGESLVAGGTYINPVLNGVEYSVFGILDETTPSGFPAFDLRRTIGGAEFYTQGSSMSFTIAGSADLSDGLQASELDADGTGKIFEFNGREVGTGRYHPALVELFSDGTGQIQNSNNTGGINPGNGLEVDVDFGDEYIVDLGFTPSEFLVAVPEPSTVSILAIVGLTGLMRRRKN